jgi:hypothetical protein
MPERKGGGSPRGLFVGPSGLRAVRPQSLAEESGGVPPLSTAKPCLGASCPPETPLGDQRGAANDLAHVVLEVHQKLGEPRGVVPEAQAAD